MVDQTTKLRWQQRFDSQSFWLNWVRGLVLFLIMLSLISVFSPYIDASSFWKAMAAATGFSLLAVVWPEYGRIALVACFFGSVGMHLYQGQIIRADTVFVLKYFLSSPAAFLWMGIGFMLSLLGYLFQFARPTGFLTRFSTISCDLAIAFGLLGMMMRWYESYLLGPKIGHLPVVSFLEGLIWLVLLLGLLFRWFDQRYGLKAMGLLVLASISVMLMAIAYKASEGIQIQPLIPALQSSWMKLHVPTSFLGYAGFALGAVCGVGIWLKWTFATNQWLPDLSALMDVMRRCIFIGLLFFSIGIITGSLWAAEAWGTYWQWDPKETWALIVWLNYAAWLHGRMTQTNVRLWASWAIIGWILSLFAFVGVNLWLPGLHSYAN